MRTSDNVRCAPTWPSWRFWPAVTAAVLQVQQAWATSQTTGLGVVFNSLALAAATLRAFLVWFGRYFVRVER